MNILIDIWLKLFPLALAVALLGTALVLKKRAIQVAALSHASLPGFAFVLLMGWPLANYGVLMGFVSLAIALTVIQFFSYRFAGAYQTTAATVSIGSLIIGLSLLQLSFQKANIQGPIPSFESFMFGSADALLLTQLKYSLSLFVVTIIALVLAYPFVKIWLFDSFLFQTTHPTASKWFNISLSALTLFMVVQLFEIMGPILAPAIIIIPAQSALLIAKRTSSLFGYAILTTLIAFVLGTFISYTIPNLASGACISLSATLIYLLIRLWIVFKSKILSYA